MPQLTLDHAERLTKETLLRAGACESMAVAAAQHLVKAEAQGIASHGLIRAPQYANHLQTGRVNGQAKPILVSGSTAVQRVDAQHGLSFEACSLAVDTAIKLAQVNGIGLVGVFNSHHAGVLVDQMRPVADAGMIGLAFANTPSAMPAAGGKTAFFGTNPISAIFPREHHSPLLIDMSLSEAARGKVIAASQAGKPIPLGWALDANGAPTTDAKAALAGSMLPLGGGAKGSLLAMMIEVMVGALIGSHFSHEAMSYFDESTDPPSMGQCFIVINPRALAGSVSYYQRFESLLTDMLADDGVRLPGALRYEREAKAQSDGVYISDDLFSKLKQAAG